MRDVTTIAQAFHDISQGEQPWLALGNFMNEWFDYSKGERAMLVADLPVLPHTATDEQMQWAVFCAASVEWLCLQAQLPCPQWVAQFPALPEPWFEFDAPGLQNPIVQARLRACTPEPFARRNIFCGDRVFATKYDFVGQSRRVAAQRLV